MTRVIAPTRLDLWQDVGVGQHDVPDGFIVSTPATDGDALTLIADGYIDITHPGTKRGFRKVMKVLAVLGRPLDAEISCCLLDIGAFVGLAAGDKVRVYCHQAVSEVGGTNIGLLCGLSAPLPGVDRAPAKLMDAAIMAVTHHRALLADIEAQKALQEIEDARSLETASPEYRAVLQKAISLRSGLSGASFPTLDARPLLPLFPPGLVVKITRPDASSVERAITKAILSSPDSRHPPSRDGWYDAAVATLNPKLIKALVTWEPHRGLPPYPEIRAAAERRLPRAFLSPRSSGVNSPEFDSTIDAVSRGVQTVGGFDPADQGWSDALDDFSLGFDFPDDIAQAAKDRLRRLGFEALGWYQPHHNYTEQAWGIYIDAERLDETACSISKDLRRSGYGRRDDRLAAKLAMMLVYQHELFHAKAEAALTWAELHALKPIFRPYQTKVYAPLRESDGSLEEALANFWAWSWISADSTMLQFTGAITDDQRAAIESVAQAHLDLSPPGYRRWREGHGREIWRVLATQMAQGRPKLPAPGIGLPIEPTLREKLPFDFIEAEDVPVRFVGKGRIASRILSAPSTLRWPSRAELRAVITRHFKYELVPGEGKGSHEKFRNSGGRMFPLPKTDPVSQRVFKTFLAHFGLSKGTYIQIRQTV